MSGFDYGEVLATVNELLLEFGEPVILRKFTDTTSSQPWRPGAPSHVDYATKRGVFFPNGLRGPFRLALRPYSEVSQSDIVCYVPGDIVPEPLRILENDVLLRRDGTQWRMRYIDYLEPAGTVMFYELRLHR